MLIFEKGQEGRSMTILPECDVPVKLPEEGSLRKKSLRLPQVSENDISRHYTEAAKKAYGVNDGFYPLGSCTMLKAGIGIADDLYSWRLSLWMTLQKKIWRKHSRQ